MLNDLIFYVFSLNIKDETSTPNRKTLDDEAEAVRRPERYARKWRKLAQVNDPNERDKSIY